MASNSAPTPLGALPPANTTEYKPKGYHKLAKVMAQDMDAAIFHRFEDLSLLSLLSLQAEIIDLRKEFRRICSLDDTEGGEVEKKYSGNFKAARDGESDQYRILRAIRSKLKEYCNKSKCLTIGSYQ
jgi:hypothetical protein